jgi:catechol 2,3-dioxygenase-like lactoylglutathione lyase family enzyme
MQGVVSEAVPVCYVRNLDRARDFYALFGFAELRGGEAGGSRWSYLRSGANTVLLAAVQPPLIGVELPLLIYFYVDDLGAVGVRLAAAGVKVEHVGYPDHAPGGEVRVIDPDGNVLLVGQRTAVAPEDRVEPTGEAARFSLMHRAAEAVGHRGGAPQRCQIGYPDGEPCERPAEVKLADPWGETVWGCIPHADEALVVARSAFIATEDGLGLGPFLRDRHRRPTAS